MSKRDYLPFDSPDEQGVMLVPLTQGLFAKIDAADCELAALYRWSAIRMKSKSQEYWYAGRGRGGYSVRLLHRLIVDASEDQLVDHESHDTLDCRRSNIRIASPSQNACNRRSHIGATSSYLGVYWNKSVSMWMAAICSKGVRRTLGRFSNEIEAARAYDAAARELHGEYANLNFK